MKVQPVIFKGATPTYGEELTYQFLIMFAENEYDDQRIDEIFGTPSYTMPDVLDKDTENQDPDGSCWDEALTMINDALGINIPNLETIFGKAKKYKLPGSRSTPYSNPETITRFLNYFISHFGGEGQSTLNDVAFLKASSSGMFFTDMTCTTGDATFRLSVSPDSDTSGSGRVSLIPSPSAGTGYRAYNGQCQANAIMHVFKSNQYSQTSTDYVFKSIEYDDNIRFLEVNLEFGNNRILGKDNFHVEIRPELETSTFYKGEILIPKAQFYAGYGLAYYETQTDETTYTNKYTNMLFVATNRKDELVSSLKKLAQDYEGITQANMEQFFTGKIVEAFASAGLIGDVFEDPISFAVLENFFTWTGYGNNLSSLMRPSMIFASQDALDIILGESFLAPSFIDESTQFIANNFEEPHNVTTLLTNSRVSIIQDATWKNDEVKGLYSFHLDVGTEARLLFSYMRDNVDAIQIPIVVTDLDNFRIAPVSLPPLDGVKSVGIDNAPSTVVKLSFNVSQSYDVASNRTITLDVYTFEENVSLGSSIFSGTGTSLDWKNWYTYPYITNTQPWNNPGDDPFPDNPDPDNPWDDPFPDPGTDPNPDPLPSPDVDYPSPSPAPTNPNPSEPEGDSPWGPGTAIPDVPSPGGQDPGSGKPSAGVSYGYGGARYMGMSYVVDSANMQYLANTLWKKDIWDKLRDLIESPEDLVINCHMIPFNIMPPTTVFPGVGQNETSIDLTWLLPDEVYNIKGYPIGYCMSNILYATVQLPRYWNNYADYPPFSRARAYIPFVGFVELDPREILDTVINPTISLAYGIDIVTGAATAILSSSKAGILGVYPTNMSYEIPITSRDFTQWSKVTIEKATAAAVTLATAGAGAAFSVGSGAAAAGGSNASAQYITPQLVDGIKSLPVDSNPSYSMTPVTGIGSLSTDVQRPIIFDQPQPINLGTLQQVSSGYMIPAPTPSKVQAVANGINSAANAVESPAVRNGGGLSGNNGFLAPLEPGIYLTYSVPNWSDGHTQLLGNYSNVAGKLSDFSGYTEFSTIELDSGTAITLSEQEEIKHMLNGGVVI